jgi:hypothetical protein
MEMSYHYHTITLIYKLKSAKMNESKPKEERNGPTRREQYIMALIVVMMVTILILTGYAITQKAALAQANARCNQHIMDLAEAHPASTLAYKMNMTIRIGGPP